MESLPCSLADNVESTKLLSRFFGRHQRKFPRYSMRALARDLGVAPSYLSDVLNGRRHLAERHLVNVARLLRLDTLEKRDLERALVRDRLPAVAKESIATDKSVLRKGSSGHERISKETDAVLDSWLHFALMDLLTCEDESQDPASLGQRLSVHEYDVQHSLNLLEANKLIEKCPESGRYRKSNLKLRTRRLGPNRSIREIHQSFLQKAIETLRKQTTEKDLAARQISGLTVAVNPKNIEKAKLYLEESLYEVADILSEGECTEVYHLGTTLFPLTKIDGDHLVFNSDHSK